MILYPWPFFELDVRLNDALGIAMDYLERTEQAYPYSEIQKEVADVILTAWRSGVSNRIRLANYAIVAIERKKASPQLPVILPEGELDLQKR
jgi:hypothetical protein